MVEGNEVGDPAAAKPSSLAEVVVLRREIERVHDELHEMREAHAGESAAARTRSLEAVGRLAGGIAHDFDNLITSLLDNLEGAKRLTSAGSPAEPHLDRATSIARDAGRITKQLLSFAGQGMGQGKGHGLGDRDAIDLAQETQRSLVILRRLVDADVDVIVDVPSEPTWVFLERGHLTQILLNLVVNARDAMPGGGKLTIEVRPLARPIAPGAELHPGGMLRFADSGAGIPASDLPRIFDPFFTTKLPGRGAGLGLSTVFGLVQSSGGDVTVRSEEGKGSTFDLWFRAAPAPAAAAKSRRSPQLLAPVGVAAPVTRPTILVVEDNASLAETCVAIFEGAGYRVLVAPDGVAALEVVARERDVATVLSDVVMPRLSGIELARKLAVTHPGIRLVLWSGYPQELSTEALRGAPGGRSNVVSVLPKPVEADTLLRAVSDAAARS